MFAHEPSLSCNLFLQPVLEYMLLILCMHACASKLQPVYGDPFTGLSRQVSRGGLALPPSAEFSLVVYHLNTHPVLRSDETRLYHTIVHPPTDCVVQNAGHKFYPIFIPRKHLINR